MSKLRTVGRLLLSALDLALAAGAAVEDELNRRRAERAALRKGRQKMAEDYRKAANAAGPRKG